MTRLARPGGHVAVIDMEGNENPAVDALNHEIEVLHDPTHVRSYTAGRLARAFHRQQLWKSRRARTRWWEFPAGLTVGRWCELSGSGAEALQAIRNEAWPPPRPRMAEAELEITQGC